MQSLRTTLYLYAQKDRAFRYLQTPEYQRAISGTEEGWEAFRATLTEEQKKHLNDLLSQEWETSRLEDEANFLAGVFIGLDLGRL